MFNFIIVTAVVSLCENMVWLLKSKSCRRPVVLGATCTSVLVGVIVFDHLLSHHQLPAATQLSRKCSSCSNISTQPSYLTLKKNEATQVFKDSVIKRLDVVFLSSNSPMEDRFVVGMSKNLGAAFFSMIDGHKGTHCSKYLQKHMLQHVSSHLHTHTDREDDLKVVLDMDAVERSVLLRNSEDKREEMLVVDGGAEGNGESSIGAETIKESLRQSFVNLDDTMSQLALDKVNAILSGQSMTGEVKERILTALEGACALTAMVRAGDVFVANTGDCRVVLGRRQGEGKNWKALPLSVDQNAENPDEVKRLQALHPGEGRGLIYGGRVLGNLMPFRTFGDVDFKWEKKYLQNLVPVAANYKTPPYITAEPVLSQHNLEKGDRFLILATDGFWERVTSEVAVNLVGDVISHKKTSVLDKLRRGIISRGEAGSSSDSCCDVNVATDLLWHALGGTESSVSALLRVDPKVSRMFRDDITIMVIHL